MILTRHFVVLHLPKSGSSFSTRILRDHAPDDWQVVIHEGHPTTRDIPSSHRHLPLLGTVRSPWTFYVSWYAFALRHWMHWDLVQRASDHGRRSFGATLRALFDDPEVTRHGLGAYAYLIRHVYGDRFDEIRWMRTERLRDDMLTRIGEIVPVPSGLGRALRETPPVNEGQHDDPLAYWDDDLAALVWERDRPVFDRFGYGPLEPRREPG